MFCAEEMARPRAAEEAGMNLGARLLGTGTARSSAPLLGPAFWVLYAAVLRHFLAGGFDGLMTVLRNENRWDRSNAAFRGGRLLCYNKRCPQPEMTHVDYGASLLRASALARLPAGRPCDLADLYAELVAEGRMAGYEVTQRFYEIGSPHALRETHEYLLARGA
jgi:hypothetical protein